MIRDVAVYEGGARRAGEVAFDDAFESVHERANRDDTFVWIGLQDPTDDEIDRVKEELKLHPLLAEDVHKAHQRPKLEVFDKAVFVVARSVTPSEGAEVYAAGEVHLLLGDRFVVTIGHGETPSLPKARAGLDANPQRLSKGPMAVLYGVLDEIVDGYSPVIDSVAAGVTQLGRRVFEQGGRSSDPTQDIYDLKLRVLQLTVDLEELEEVTPALMRGDVPGSEASLNDYFRDVDDHVRRLVDRIGLYGGQLTAVLESHLALVGVRQNNDMRTISAWAAIVAVPTFLAGVWGMNFTHMPELDWGIGYPFALATIAIAAYLVWRRMKSSGWL